METRAIQMDAQDNVATVLRDVGAGDPVQVYDEAQVPLCTVPALVPVPYGNKVALCDIGTGEHIVKYGEAVGVAIKPIRRGELVHVHNVRSMHLDIPDAIIQDIISIMNISEQEVQS